MRVVVGVMTRACTYAHKGIVVHILRPVIHDHNDLSAVPQRWCFIEEIGKNRALSTSVLLSTIIVDNYAGCG